MSAMEAAEARLNAEERAAAEAEASLDVRLRPTIGAVDVFEEVEEEEVPPKDVGRCALFPKMERKLNALSKGSGSCPESHTQGSACGMNALLSLTMRDEPFGMR